MRVIGLTGLIGAGKSTVAGWLSERGAHCVDADALVRRLYEKNPVVQARLQARFGAEVVEGGRVNRPALSRAVFGAPGEPATRALADLEAITHPAVMALEDEEIAAARAAGKPACVLEAIKLVESGGSARCDELWIVIASEAVRLARLEARGTAPAEARRRAAAQGTVAGWTEAFVEESARLGRVRPVVIFDNSGTRAAARREVARLWDGLAAATPRKPPAERVGP